MLKLVDHADIAGLSPDAEKIFSYYRKEAAGLPKVRPRAEDILIQKPDIVVRTYGGGPNITTLLDRTGVKVVQIPYAADLASVKTAIEETAEALGAKQRGNALIEEMDRRIAALKPGREGKFSFVSYFPRRGCWPANNAWRVDQSCRLRKIFKAQPAGRPSLLKDWPMKNRI